jgi:hypothetical protein
LGSSVGALQEGTGNADELDLSQMNEKEKKKTIAQRSKKGATKSSKKGDRRSGKEIDDRASHLLKKLPLATKTLPTHLRIL